MKIYVVQWLNCDVCCSNIIGAYSNLHAAVSVCIKDIEKSQMTQFSAKEYNEIYFYLEKYMEYNNYTIYETKLNIFP